jgi:AcrR family transcriptional regulator
MTFRADFEHRDELLRVALDEFCTRGYDATSLNRILAASGVSKGQLYHHFDGKEGLFLALVEWSLDEKARWFADHPLEPVDDFYATVRAMVVASLEFAAANPDIDRLARTLLAERGRPIYAAVVERFGFDPDSAVAALVAHHHAAGRFGADLDVELVQRVVLLVLNHLPDLLDLSRPADLEPEVDQVLGVLRFGLDGPGDRRVTPAR